MTSPSLTGKYLITRKNHVFAGTPEIFLLLQENDQITGICVNQFCSLTDGDEEQSKFSMCSQFADEFQKNGAGFYIEYLDIPVLLGGDDYSDSFCYLHTGYEGASNAHEYTENMYYLSTVRDFVLSIKEDSFPAYANMVYGNHKFTLLELSSHISSGDWELRTGLHMMTYGINLQNKFNHVEKLGEEVSTSEMIGTLDFGNVLNQTMHMFREAGPSMMSTAVFGYYLNETDLNEDQILEAVRISIALTEVDGNDITDILGKYTHTELVKKYNELIDGGFKFKLLQEFDRRREMALDLGLNPILYDDHVTRTIFHTGQALDKAQSNENSTIEDTERKLSGIEKIIRDPSEPQV